MGSFQRFSYGDALMKKKENVFESSTIEIPSVDITIEIAPITIDLKSVKKLFEDKNLWKIVLYSSLLEFYGKILLRAFFEAHKIQQKTWLKRLERLSLGQVHKNLKDLQLIDNETDKQMKRIVEIRNNVVHDILVSSLLFGASEAEEVVKHAEKCISKLANTKV